MKYRQLLLNALIRHVTQSTTRPYRLTAVISIVKREKSQSQSVTNNTESWRGGERGETRLAIIIIIISLYMFVSYQYNVLTGIKNGF